MARKLMQAVCVNAFKMLAPELPPVFHYPCNCFFGREEQLKKIINLKTLRKLSICKTNLKLGTRSLSYNVSFN